MHVELKVVAYREITTSAPFLKSGSKLSFKAMYRCLSVSLGKGATMWIVKISTTPVSDRYVVIAVRSPCDDISNRMVFLPLEA